MSEVEKVALGLRLSGREAIEYIVMEMENANGLLDTLHRDHGYQPTGAFGDLAEGRQLTRAGDSIRFHDQARRAGATRWFLHQGGEWQGGVAKRRGGPSLVSRWHNVAAAFGGDRFLPGRLRLNEDEAGLRRHCILGVLVELFRDDYPTALNLLTSPEGGPNGYVEHGKSEIYLTSLPPVVQRAVGLTTCLAAFQISHGVSSALERHYGATAEQIGAAIPGWDLMALNDYALHWPASAELIAMPAPGLFS